VSKDIFHKPNQDDERHHGKTKTRDRGGIKLIFTFQRLINLKVLCGLIIGFRGDLTVTGTGFHRW